MSNELSTKIESRIDKDATGNLSIGSGGNLDFANLNQIMEVAKVVAISQCAIPKHLRDNVGACLAICIQASEWRMSPFAVANKSYLVNDRIAFEAQLIAAVILKRAPIVGRIKYTFTGEGGKRKCRVNAVLTNDEGEVEYDSPEFDKIPTKNSPLWKSDPDQQLGYFSVRAMCRRHFPDVILGVYSGEEMAEAIDVQTTVSRPLFDAPKPAAIEGTKPAAPKPEKPKAQPPAEKAPVVEPEPEPVAKEIPAGDTEAEPTTPLHAVRELLTAQQFSEASLMDYLRGVGLAKDGQALADLAEKKLVQIAANFDKIMPELKA